MTFLRPKVFANFKEPTKRRKPRAAAKRDGNSPEYLDLIRQLPSCISGEAPCEPHHLRCGQAAKERGVGRKATDRWVVPLTHAEHMDCHSVGAKKEIQWFAERGIDVLVVASRLWEARGNLGRMRGIIEERGYVEQS